MSYIKVTAEELHSVASQLGTASSTINDANTNAMSQVTNLIGAGWDGTASAQFHELFTTWKTGATQVQEALTGISQLLNSAATTYANTEEQIRQSMSQS